jgi:hypothetical protein
MEEENKVKDPETIFPENADALINNILGKYGILDIQKKQFEKIFISKNPDERIKIFRNMPSFVVVKLLKEYLGGITPLEKIIDELTDLGIAEKTAKEVYGELEKQLIPVMSGGKKLRELPEKKPSIDSSEIKGVKPKKTDQGNAYREKIE